VSCVDFLVDSSSFGELSYLDGYIRGKENLLRLGDGHGGESPGCSEDWRGPAMEPEQGRGGI
jgi:hypothetical protein